MSDERATRWWLVRHAPVPGPAGRINGNLDLACDTSDRPAFDALARALPVNPILVESGLIRCRQTSGGLEAAGLVLPPPIVEPALAEQDFGRWQGRTWDELDAAADADLQMFWSDPAQTAPPGGESFAAVVQRVAAAMARLGAAHPGGDILAVVHAGTIRAALAVALDLAPRLALRFAVHPLSLTRLERLGDGWRVESVNVS